MKNIYLLSNQTKTSVTPRVVGVSLPSRCRVLPIILLFLTAFSLHAWGADQTEDFTSLGTQTWTSYSLTSGDVTISTDLNGGSAPTTKNAQYQWKTNNIITISLSSGTITSIRFKTNSTATYGPKNLSYGGSAINTSGTDYTWSAPSSMSSASFTVTSEARLTEIHVTYTPGSSSCSTDPTVGIIMNAVSSITATGATFSTSAGVSAGTDCTLTEVGFVYNTSGTPTISDTKAVIDGYTSGNLNKSVTGLTPNTTYYVRAFATNGHGTSYSDQKSFTTEVLPTYAIRFFNNGTQVGVTQNIAVGGTPEIPTDPAACDEGYTFVGWWTGELAEDNTISHTWVTDFTVSGAQDYYAVFSVAGAGGSTINFDATVPDPATKGGITLSVTDGALDNGTDYRVYKNKTMTITSSIGDISSITLTFTNASNDGGGWSTSYTPNAASWTSPTASGEQARITNISVTVGTTYYTTDCGSACSTPTLTFDAATINKFVGDAAFRNNLTITGNTLGADLTYTSSNPSKATVDGAGNVTILDAMSNEPITITARLAKKTVGLDCQKAVQASYTLNIYNHVTWSVNGAAYTAGGPTQQAVEGGTITAYPTDPDGATACGGKVFVGWTNVPYAESDAAPDPLYTSLSSMSSVHITDNTTFHAVFAESGGESANKYKKVTSPASEMTTGKRVLIVLHNGTKAISNVVSGIGYAPVVLTPDGSGKITTSDATIIWTVRTGSSGYYFYQGDNYLNAAKTTSGDHYLYIDEYTDEWTLTAGTVSTSSYVLNSSEDPGYKIDLYYDKFSTYTGSGEAYEFDFYVPDVGYTNYSTTCGPNIKAGEVEYLTSTKDQTVKSQAITVKGSSLNDGTLTANISGANSSFFACALASSAISAGAINTTFVISYTPGVYGDAQHTATLTFTDGTTTSDPITLRGRSLPEHFAIVAYDGANYYALDGSMSGTAKQATPLPVEVSANTVVSCPTRAIYSLTQRETPDANVYLVGPAGRLWGSSSSSDLNTKSLTSTSQTGWLLSTSDFDTYHITNADVSTRGIMYNSTNDVFGHYSTSLYGSSHYYGDIQLLPITDVCTCLPKPFPTPIARAQSVTITWAEVPGAVSYVVTCSGGNAPVYDGCKATITGLSNSTNYTYTVKAVASGNDCSLIYSGNFTTTDCDDVPYAISVAPALTSATFRWSMEAASATIRIYSDEECTAQVGSDHTGLTSPATITGLAENTTYYAKIWAGGTCVSAVTSFTTNSPSVELAEWFTDSIRIVVDAGADASVIIEDKNDNGSSTASVAEDIFFSKYYEAAGFTKLVGLYNGTDHDIDLSDLKIIGGTTSWSTSKSDNNYVVLKDVSKLVSDYGDGAGHIYLPRGTEIIFYSLNDDNSSSGTKPMTGDGCLDEFYGWDELANNTVDNWYRIGNLSAGSDGDGHTTLNFSGPYSIGLKRGSKLIDIIGAGNVSAPTNSATVKVTDSKTLGNGRTVATPNDKEGFWYENGWSPRPMEGDVDYASYPDGYSTYLSTNRCLLIRANHVVSGDSAVQNNKSEFKTLGEYEDEEFKKHKGEWVGIPIGKISNSTEDYCFSGQQFGYVGSYDYNAYYATYDSIAELKNLTGKQNDDGTYTIPIPQLDTLSCTMLRVNVYEGSELKTSAEYKVPIMVEGNKTTQDTIFVSDYPTQKRTAETCKECDVVILKGATLTKAVHTGNDVDLIRNLTIYPGGTMNIPNSRTFNVASVQFRVEGENVPFIKLSGTLKTSDQQVLVSRRINNSDAYFFSLPYDCNISDIRWSNGEPAVLDNGFRIKEYDSRARADEGSTKGAPGHWKMVTGSTLEAGKGYQISVNSKYLKELIFPLDLGKTNVSDAENEKHYNSDNVVPIHQYENVATTINNHNWNFIAQPYLCAMTPMAGDAITYGYLDWKVENDEVVWERKEVGNQYLTIYDPSSKTYTQKFWNAVSQLDPFLAFFVQGKAEGTFTFVEGNRLNNAPARHLASQAEVDEDPSIFVGVTLSGNGLTDQANLRVRQDFTEDEYKLGYDLLKFTTYYKDRPQVYMKTPSYQLAFQAVNDSVAKNTFLPMGVYCYKPGTYTFGLSNDYPIDEVEAVYLYDKVSGVTTNLLYDTYTITTSSQLYTNTRFALNVIVNRRAPQVTTDIGIPEAPDNMVRKILINGHVYIQRGAAIYDITGKQMLNF